MAGSSGWELALVTAQTASSRNQLTEMKLVREPRVAFPSAMHLQCIHVSHHILHLHCVQWFLQAGGFDGLLLDSLYEDAARRQQQQATYSTDPHVDPFAASTSVAPPTDVQISMMAHQQQEMFGMPFQQPQSYAAASQSQANPFGDAYSAMLPLPQSNPFHGHGSSSLI
jgi:hypothetical protein